MTEKLIVALDVADFESAKSLVKDLGNDIKFYKIGLELMASGDYFRIIDFLKSNNKKIFADLKLYDISQTIGRSVKNLAKFEIDILTIHCASREIMLRASENKGKMQIVGVTVLTNLNEKDLQEMGFDKTNSLENLVLKKAEMALESKLDGVVASAQEAQNLRNKFGQNFLIVTPGIRAEKILNDDQKRVADVKTALTNGASHLVVGRPITQSENPYLSAQKFIKLINEFTKNS
jgi:orotidine-5'-phosphate decarboxylase